MRIPKTRSPVVVAAFVSLVILLVPPPGSSWLGGLAALLALWKSVKTALRQAKRVAIRVALISGTLLDASGRLFADIGSRMNSLLDQRRITERQYRAWAMFAGRFKSFYPRAVKWWARGKAVLDLMP